jgi:hypothetical protein
MSSNNQPHLTPDLVWVSDCRTIPISHTPLDFHQYRIQEVRLIQALIEAKWEVGIPPQIAATFLAAGQEYCVKVSPIAQRWQNLKIIIDHEKPRTAVEAIERTLIFPEAFFYDARKSWSSNRPVRMAFSGFPTPSRLNLALTLCKLNCNKWNPILIALKLSLPCLRDFQNNWSLSWVNKLLRQLLPEDHIEFTSRGRNQSLKIRDERYLALLLGALFALCPKGDFVWTYRFYEATICGCSPVIDQGLIHYEGYFLLHIGDDLQSLSTTELEANYQKSFEELTCRTELEHFHKFSNQP